jgi:hypothetical protein
MELLTNVCVWVHVYKVQTNKPWTFISSATLGIDFGSQFHTTLVSHLSTQLEPTQFVRT